MPGVLYDANNVVVGHAVMWYAPWVAGSVKPLIADATAVFNVTAWETAGWTAAGATNEGFKVNVETSTTTVTIEEQSTPVGERLESRTLTIEAALAEDTLETMKLSWGGSTITTVAGPPAKRTMTLSDDIGLYTVALEMKNKGGFARRLYIPKVSITGSGEVSFRRAADKRLYPIRCASLSAPTEIQVVDFTA